MKPILNKNHFNAKTSLLRSGWILDLDGTLISMSVPIEAVRRQVSTLFQDYGVSFPFRPLLPQIDSACAMLALSQSSFQVLELKRKAFQIIRTAEIAAAEKAKPCDGALEFITEIRDCPVVIVTNNDLKAAELGLENCAVRPTNLLTIIGRDLDHPTKPHPWPIIQAAQWILSISKKPNKIYCVGDGVVDIGAAQAAASELPLAGSQLFTIGIAFSPEHEKQLQAVKPDWIVDSLREIIPLLENTITGTS